VNKKASDEEAQREREKERQKIKNDKNTAAAWSEVSITLKKSLFACFKQRRLVKIMIEFIRRN
jgi:hypothetical protein